MTSRNTLGTLALEWCAFAYLCALLWFVLVLLLPLVAQFPAPGSSLWWAIQWFLLIAAGLFALASAGLGLSVAIHVGLITRGPPRQAQDGLLAVILSIGVPVATCWCLKPL